MLEGRRDPFSDLGDEPVEALGVIPSLRNRPTGQRRTAKHPSELRRRLRKVTVTFSEEQIVARLRALAERWQLKSPDGVTPNVSAVVEHLLLAQLEKAERGEVTPPGGR